MSDPIDILKAAAVEKLGCKGIDWCKITYPTTVEFLNQSYAFFCTIECPYCGKRKIVALDQQEYCVLMEHAYGSNNEDYAIATRKA